MKSKISKKLDRSYKRLHKIKLELEKVNKVLGEINYNRNKVILDNLEGKKVTNTKDFIEAVNNSKKGDIIIFDHTREMLPCQQNKTKK